MTRKLSSAALAAMLALAGAVAADGPGYVPATPAPMSPIPIVAGMPAPGCGGCGTCVQKTCKPITEPREIIKPHYTSVCEDFCEVRCPGCNLFGGLFGHGCASCGCNNCGPDHACSQVKTRKILVVRLRPEKQCVNKCVVDYTVVTPARAPPPAASRRRVPPRAPRPAPRPHR